MSATQRFEEPLVLHRLEHVEAGGNADSPADRKRLVAFYGFVLVGGVALGEVAWLSAIAYFVYRLCV